MIEVSTERVRVLMKKSDVFKAQVRLEDLKDQIKSLGITNPLEFLKQVNKKYKSEHKKLRVREFYKGRFSEKSLKEVKAFINDLEDMIVILKYE